MDAYEAIAADRAVAVIRADRVADPVGLANALAEAGIRCVEFTLTIPDALAAIAATAEKSSAYVGAGTVVRAEQAHEALAAGASFVVSPVCAPELVEACADVPVFLGGFTPTEVQAAVAAGAVAVKLFPAAVGGPSYVKDLLGPFPDVRLLPSGGVSERNARDFLAAGAVAVYAGSRLAPPELLRRGDHEEIGRRARSFVASLS